MAWRIATLKFNLKFVTKPSVGHPAHYYQTSAENTKSSAVSNALAFRRAALKIKNIFFQR